MSLLKDIATIKVGYQARGKIHHFKNTGYKLLQGKDVDDDALFEVDKLVSFIPDRNPDLYTVRKYDILFQSRGSNNKSFCIGEIIPNVLAASSFYIIRVTNSDLMPEYLVWYLNLPDTLAKLQSESGGSTISFIAINKLATLELIIPPLKVQSKIVVAQGLMQDERILNKNIQFLRNKLVDAVCKNAICHGVTNEQ